MSSHEPLKKRRAVTLGSDRRFGCAFAAIFAAIALWPLLRHGAAVRPWALATAAALAAAAAIRPSLLRPFNRLWFEFGRAIHRVVEPVLMALIFAGAIVPLAMLMRLFGRDALRLKRTGDATYWIARQPPGPAAGSLTKQF